MAKMYGARNDGIRDIVFTFDDGPNPKTTPRLLDILAANDIKATFFVLGEKIKTAEGKKIVERAYKEGHVIGNHTFTHPNLRNLDPAKVKEEIKRTFDLLCEITGNCILFRPPYGSMSGDVQTVLSEFGLGSVLWNVDTMDWKLKTEGQWVDHAMEQIKAREDSLVLMHDIHASTVDNVEKLISRIRRISNNRFALY